MIATLRHKLIRVPTRLIRHVGALTLRLHRDTTCSKRSPTDSPRSNATTA